MTARKLNILYGSQTGTAQDVAEYIWRESKKYHFTGTVVPMDQYDVKTLIHEQLVIFVCSTTGQGNEPDNMKEFWKFLLRKSLPKDSLNGLSYAVLGLGDSSYNQFNFVAKRLNRRLQQLGGTQIIPIGLCDDQHDLGPSAVYMPWINELWEKMLELRPLDDGLNVLTASPRNFRWTIEVCDEKSEAVDENFNIFDSTKSIVDGNAFSTEVLSNIRTTDENHFQDVRLVSLSCENVKWNPGDVVVVRPQNPDEEVNDLFELFAEHNIDLEPNSMVKVTEIDSELPVPEFLQKPLPLKTIAKQLWDIKAIPRPRTFELLLLNCNNELEREKLLEFTQPSGLDELYSYANRPRRTILETLNDFPHATSQLTIKILFEIFPFIKPRSFSIASCMEDKKLDILVAVVDYKTILAKRRTGLCSNWLKNLKKGDVIRASIKKGTFKLPVDNSVPIVMVGPGTGLAPFRSMLMHWLHHCDVNYVDERLWFSRTLFFGCRSEKFDFHCRGDLKQMESVKMLRLFTAFSRDQEDKIYVQHRIKEQKDHLKQQIQEKNGLFLVAGNSKNMPTAVKEALGEALGDSNYVEEMIKMGRYQQETWS